MELLKTKKEPDASVRSDPARKYFQLGCEKLALYDIEGYEEAVAYFLQAIAENPADASAHAGLAEAYAYWGFRRELEGAECASYYALAYDAAKTALQRAPEKSETHRAMSAALRRGKHANPDRRKAEILVALDLDPLDAKNWYEHWRAFGYDLSSSSIWRALELDPGLCSAHIDLGAVFTEEGRLDEAVQHLAKAVQLSPRNSLAYYDLAMVLDRLGRRDQAREVLEQAKKMHPDLVLIDEGLKLLGGGGDGSA